MQTSAPIRLAWHVLAALVLVLAPTQLWLGEPVWQSTPARILQVLAVAAAYGLGVAATPIVLRGADRGPLLRLAVPGAFLAGAYLAVLMAAPGYSRGILLASSGLFGLGVGLPLFVERGLAAATGLAGVAVLALTAAGLLGAPGDEGEAVVAVSESELIVTSRHRIRSSRYLDLFTTVRGGGLERLGDDLLLVTGEGELSRIRLAGDSIVLRPVGLRVPLNREDFLAATDTTIRQDDFRTMDVLAQPVGDSTRIVVSHHYWKPEEACFVVRFSQAVVGSAELTGDAGSDAGDSTRWRTLHETRPCLPLKDAGSPFAGLESGGRIQPLGDTAILVTVGDHEFDGVNSPVGIAQSMDHEYGKTLILPLDGAAPRIFTLGHRNPQGLLAEPNGQIWVTEHGPEGGDELNLLVDGANYGWPLQTHGTQYEELTWPLTDDSAAASFTGPRFSWVPSVAVTNLIAVQGDGFHGWRGDLLVGSLAGRSLYRIHREGDRIVYVEPIPVDRRVRDLIETPDGRLVLWADGSLLVLTAADNDPHPEAAAPE